MFRSALLVFALTCLLENSVLGRPSDDVKNIPSQSSALSEQEIDPSNEEMYDRAPLPIINDANYMSIGQGKDKQRITGDVSRSTRRKRSPTECSEHCSQWGLTGHCRWLGGGKKWYSSLCYGDGYGWVCRCYG